jgi:AraC family transcriptional regulator
MYLKGDGTNMSSVAGEVRIVDFPETKVAVFRHRGDPERIGESVLRFVEWRRAHRLPPDRSATYNILYNDPETVAPEDFRMDLCAAIGAEHDGSACGILYKTIPAGRCAVLRLIGSNEHLGESIRVLLLHWFPSSGEKRRNYPLFLQRVRFLPEVQECESVTDIFLPLA